MVRGAGCREINLRLRRREKNVLDIPFYRSSLLRKMPLLRWSNPGHDTRPASSLVSGAGCRKISLRIRWWEKIVLDIPFYRSSLLRKMPLLRWSNPGHDTRPASSLVRGAGCRKISLRIRWWEKIVLDIPFYRSGHYTHWPGSKRNRDSNPIRNSHTCRLLRAGILRKRKDSVPTINER